MTSAGPFAGTDRKIRVTGLPPYTGLLSRTLGVAN